jgi:hypothetical protein
MLADFGLELKIGKLHMCKSAAHILDLFTLSINTNTPPD